jgi:hypothetical protein
MADSPLSITANVIGIVTFVLAIVAAIYARWLWLKSRLSLRQEQAQEQAELYSRLEVFIGEMAYFESFLPNQPSARLNQLIHQIYVDQILVVRAIIKFERTTSITRSRATDRAMIFGFVGALEMKMNTLRSWVIQEQIREQFSSVFPK